MFINNAIPVFRDITPDGKWILFVYLDPKNRTLMMKNLENGEEQSLGLPGSTLLWWLPGKKEFLGVSQLNNDIAESIFIFNTDTKELKRIESGVININRWSTTNALPSPDFSYLAFVQAGTRYLYIQTICLN
jgi:Tol biopolymer transport system component